MPSQIGHSLAGLCGFGLVEKRLVPETRKWLLLGSILLANLADVDLLLGLLFGDYDRFHGQATHSITAVVVVGLVIAVLAKQWNPNRLTWGIWGGGLYLSHIILDLLGGKVQILWPLSQAYFGVPWKVFGTWDLFAPLLDIFKPLFSPYIFGKIQKRFSEVVVMTPLVVLAWCTGNYLSRRIVPDFGPARTSPGQHPVGT